MNYKWIRKNNSDKIIIFFNGWGMDEYIVSHLDCEDFDVIVFYDYSNLDINIDFLNYKEKHLVAWSTGVMTATLFDFGKLDSAIAICGTPRPIDQWDTETPLRPLLPPSLGALERPVQALERQGAHAGLPGTPLTAAVDVEAFLLLLVLERLVEQQHALLVGSLHVAVHREVVVGQQQLALGLLHQLLLVVAHHVQRLQEVLHCQVKILEPSVHGAPTGEAYESQSTPTDSECPREWMQLWVL